MKSLHGRIDKDDKWEDIESAKWRLILSENRHRPAVFSSTLLSTISSFPPWVFQNNSWTTIDAEQSGGKITVIKRELQAEQSLLCLKEHTRSHKHSNINN